MTFLTLDAKGVAAAVLLGLVLFVLNGFRFFFVIFMLYFLILSAIVTVSGMKRKKQLGVYEASRSIANVLSNGCGPLIFAVVVFFSMALGHPFWTCMALVGFGSSVASITADKFSSEIGLLDGIPRDILNMRKVRRGVSGGITALGLSAGLFAAVLIAAPFGAIASLIFPVNLAGLTFYVLLAATIGGFAGTLVDSMLGHFEEKGIGNKFTSNFFCSICGGMVGILVLALILI